MPENSQSTPLSYQPKVQSYSFRTVDTSAAPTPPASEPKKSESKQQPPESSSTGQKKGTNLFILLALEIIGLIIVFIVFLLILNFFNLISLSRMYPKQFGLLPRLNQTQTKMSTNPNPLINNNPPTPTPFNAVDLAKSPMGICPLPEGCRNAIQITNDSGTGSALQHFNALGFKLTSSDSPILAMREGNINIEHVTENGENISVVTITDPENIQQYVYKFGEAAYFPSISSGNIKEGQIIGTLKSASTITYSAKPYSLILYMLIKDSKSYLNLIPSADGKTLESPNH